MAERNGWTEEPSGRAEERAALVKNLKSIGIPIEKIAQATNLTEEEIEKM